ncbi:hypothetical protein KSS87_004777 [Heliosperma pusillum]|nr:hypothetical protein KSS87_004777 [Heliosperma pusillum]
MLTKSAIPNYFSCFVSGPNKCRQVPKSAMMIAASRPDVPHLEIQVQWSSGDGV